MSKKIESMSRTMKDSGIPWIGEIPEGWKIGKVKNFYRFITGFTPDTKNDEYYDNENGTPWATISDLSSKYVESTKSGISELYISLKHPTIIPINSLLYSFKLSVGQVAKTKIELYTNEAIAAFLPTENISLDYLYYSSQICIIENANENIYGAKLLNQDLIYNSVIVFPPLAEQHLIATFLDKKCSEIDSLIELQEQMIEELKVYKQSVITEAVTKGLNPAAPMRDSGIEWIGSIPEHWKVRRIGSLFKLRDEKNYKPMDEVQLLSLYTGIGVFPHGEQEERGNKAVTTEGYKIVRKNDVVVNIILAWMGAIGVSNYDGVTSPAYDVYIPAPNAAPHYFHYVFRTKGIAAECYKYGRGIMMMRWRTYSSEFKQIHIPYPNITEQQAIANYLDKKCGEIDELITIKQQKIESLKEYKKSVIYEYVTGKREV